MNPVQASLRRLASDLASTGHDWALVGGLAIGARAEERFTRDVDVALAVRDDQEAEGVGQALLRAGYRFMWELEQTRVGRLAGMRFLPPEDDECAVVDLLFASSGIEPEVAAAAEALEIFPGLTVPVATTGHLIALKTLSQSDQRPQDTADLARLVRAASDDDLALAERALVLIRSRGYQRDKADLVADLRAAVARYRGGDPEEAPGLRRKAPPPS